jgi:putative oxidoreductase
MIKRFFFDCGTRDATASHGILALRVLTGLMMLVGHGIPKIKGFAARKDLFYVPDIFPLRHMSPQVSLSAAILAEAVAALLIIAGLATRPAAFVLAFCMVVAAFGFHGGSAWFVSPPTVMEAKELALLYLIPMIALILTGGGALSLDALIHKEGKRRRW